MDKPFSDPKLIADPKILQSLSPPDGDGFINERTREDLLNLQNSLIGLLSTQPQLNFWSRTERKVLNIACGRADETAVLRNVFGGPGVELEMVGADIRRPEIQQAQQRWKPLRGADTRFLVQDGSKLKDVKAMSKADIAFIRHQNYWNGPAVWRQLFEQTVSHLRDEGILIITSYFDREHQLAKQELAQQGLTLLSELRSQNSRPTKDAPGKSTDRWLALYEK